MRYVALVGIVAVFLMNCGGMSEEEFRLEIAKDVQELCTQDYSAGFNHIMSNCQLNGDPEPKRIPDLIDTYTTHVYNSEAKIGQYEIITDVIGEYPKSRKTQAATILIRSSAYCSAYGQYFALHIYQSMGEEATNLSVEDTFRIRFMNDFFMPYVFHHIYTSAVPDSTELDPRTAFSEELLTAYSNWYVNWLTEGEG